MVRTIDMQNMRYLNLFEKITRVRTRFCFKYNEMIIFCVPKPLISKSIGEGGKNVKEMRQITGKKIKVIAAPRDIIDIENFIKDIISPTSFKELEIKDNEVLINAGKDKAAMIGRNKRRLLEMQKIVREFFEKEFRIV